MDITEKIKKLKEEKNAVILAHYYVRPEVQEIADYIGDSFYLSKVAVGLKEQTIVFAGVSFMGESAKIDVYKRQAWSICQSYRACGQGNIVPGDRGFLRGSQQGSGTDGI